MAHIYSNVRNVMKTLNLETFVSSTSALSAVALQRWDKYNEIHLCVLYGVCRHSLDGDDTLRRGVSWPINLYLSRRDVANCVDVASAATNHTTDCVCRHQQSLWPTQSSN